MRMTLLRFNLGTTFIGAVSLAVPDSPAWTIPVAVLCLGWDGTGLYQGVRSLKAHRRMLARHERTLQLEKELGYEPLNLHELDDILKQEPPDDSAERRRRA